MIHKLCVFLAFLILIFSSLENNAYALIKISNNTGDLLTVHLIGHDTGCESKDIKLKPYEKDVHVKYHSVGCEIAPINEVTIKGSKGKQVVNISGTGGFGDFGDFHFYINSGGHIKCNDKIHYAPYKVKHLPGSFYDC